MIYTDDPVEREYDRIVVLVEVLERMDAHIFAHKTKYLFKVNHFTLITESHPELAQSIRDHKQALVKSLRFLGQTYD